jgi:broad specificity phosphatase PhoE
LTIPTLRIGLIRHFPVKRGMPQGWMTAAHLQTWRTEYDASETIAGPIDAGTHAWERCLSSDLPRAYTTAKAVYSGEITQTPLLREVEVTRFETGNLQLPVWAWSWVLRLAWITSHPSVRPARDDFMRRVRAVGDLLENGGADTLVVSHAGMMAYLRADLLKRGFSGPRFKLAEHARLYVFENTKADQAAAP